jgi:DNA-binding SARP family transcriptional activator
MRLLGELAVEVDGRPCPPPDHRPAALLLAWLALHPGLHARSAVAAALWPDDHDDIAHGRLRSAVASARRALGDAADDHLVAGRFTVGLGGPSSAVLTDVGEFDALVARGAFDDALALLRGSLLEQFDDDWVVRLRAEHQVRVDDARRALGLVR